MVMQVLVLAVQNAVEYRDLGTATSSAIFFRSMGSVFGLAIFGTIFASRLSYWMPRLIPSKAGAHISHGNLLHMNPAQLRALPPVVHHGLIYAFSNSIHSVFLWAIPFAVAGFLITLLLKEIPLSERKQPVGTGVAEDVGMPLEGGVAEPAPAGEGR